MECRTLKVKSTRRKSVGNTFLLLSNFWNCILDSRSNAEQTKTNHDCFIWHWFSENTGLT